MAGWLYSLSILFIFQSIDEAYTPSLVGLMAEVNDPTSVYNNPGALGFISVDKKFQINLFIDAESSFKIEKSYLHGELQSSFLQLTLGNNALISLYAFGFYFGMKDHQELWLPIIARRFGNFAAGFHLRDNSLNLGTLLVVNDKLRVGLSGNIIYDSIKLRGRGGFIYQPSDWYNIGFDVFPYSKRFKIANSFLCHRFGLDKVCMGLEIDDGKINPEWETFIQGIFSFEYLQLAVGWNSGISSSADVIDSISDSYGFYLICSLHFGF